MADPFFSWYGFWPFLWGLTKIVLLLTAILICVAILFFIVGYVYTEIADKWVSTKKWLRWIRWLK